MTSSFEDDPLPGHEGGSRKGRDIDSLDNFHICSKILPRLENKVKYNEEVVVVVDDVVVVIVVVVVVVVSNVISSEITLLSLSLLLLLL